MKKFIYTEQELKNMVELLNQLEVKGRQQHIAIEMLFQILENGIEHKDEVGE